MNRFFNSRRARLSTGLAVSLVTMAVEGADSLKRQIEMQVRAAEVARSDALVNVDVDGLRKMTAADYIHIESNGKLRTREQFLQGLVDSDYRFNSFVIDRIQIIIIGDVAIASGDYHNDIVIQGVAQPTKYARFTRAWKRDGEQWVNITHQATEYKKPTP